MNHCFKGLIMDKNPVVSVIVPSYNSSQFLPKCLDAIKSSDYTNYEVIVVDDASTDESPRIASQAGVRVIHMDKQSGPGAARNVGAQHAKGDIYFFVDSDVVIKPNSISYVISNFLKNPEVGALFGSYDNQPAAINFCSQYKNLFHHFIHQTSYNEANTFWAGCGAVRKEVFHKVGGFDTINYTRPSIEDIELGLRISKQGYKILIVKELQVKHLKKWGLQSLLYTDIFCRAVPWSNLILKSQEMPKGLNFQKSHLVSSLCIGLLVGLGIFCLLEYKLFSFIPMGPLYYYIKLSGIAIFLVANLVVFYMRMFRLLDKGRHLKYLLPMLFFIVSGFALTIGIFSFFNLKFLTFIPNTVFYYYLKFGILIVFLFSSFIIFYLKIPTVITRSWQWNVMIRCLFIVTASVVIILSILAFRNNFGYNSILSLAALYFTFILIATNILLLNSRLYWFFFNLKGLKFLLLVIYFNMLYYLYSGGTFVICWIIHSGKKLLGTTKTD